mgnify:CR=1 FL=1
MEQKKIKVIKDSPKGDKKINSYLTGNNGDAVTYIETTYPEMAKEYGKICQEQYELFCRKQSNYGPSNIAVGTDLKKDEDSDRISYADFSNRIKTNQKYYYYLMI